VIFPYILGPKIPNMIRRCEGYIFTPCNVAESRNTLGLIRQLIMDKLEVEVTAFSVFKL
jgi:hypothetical protein